MKYIFGAVVRPDEEDGGFWVEVPDLPGCYGQGETFMDAVRSISDGVETHVAAILEDGGQVPSPTQVRADDGEVVYVYADPGTVELGEPSYTASEAADILGVTSGRVSQLISAGKLKARREGRSTWVTIASVEAYKAAPRKPGRPAAVPSDAMEA